MLVLLMVHGVGKDSVTLLALDPWKIEHIRPAHLEDNVCYVSTGTSSWRVESSFEDLIIKINKARMEGK